MRRIQFPNPYKLLIAAMLVIVLLAACGSGAQTEEPEAMAPEAAQPTEAMMEDEHEPMAEEPMDEEPMEEDSMDESMEEPMDEGAQADGSYQLGFEAGNPNLKATDPSTVSLEAGKPQYIDFFAFWCTYCKQMAPVSHGLEDKYGDAVNFVYLDIDDPNTQSLQQAFSYNSRWRPYIILLDSNGEVYGQPFIGVTDGALVEQAIIDMLNAEGNTNS